CRRAKALTGPAPPRRSVCAPNQVARPFMADRPKKETAIMRFPSLLQFVTCVLRGRAVRRLPAPCRPAVEALETRALPTGSFAVGGLFPTGGYNTTSRAAGDFNHDGATDLATVNADNSTVAVLLGNGDGTFAGAVTYPAGSGIRAVAAGDFNGDGNLDLAVA